MSLAKSWKLTNCAQLLLVVHSLISSRLGHVKALYHQKVEKTHTQDFPSRASAKSRCCRYYWWVPPHWYWKLCWNITDQLLNINRYPNPNILKIRQYACKVRLFATLRFVMLRLYCKTNIGNTAGVISISEYWPTDNPTPKLFIRKTDIVNINIGPALLLTD